MQQANAFINAHKHESKRKGADNRDREETQQKNVESTPRGQSGNFRFNERQQGNIIPTREYDTHEVIRYPREEEEWMMWNATYAPVEAIKHINASTKTDLVNSNTSI